MRFGPYLLQGGLGHIYSRKVWAIFTLGRFGPYLTQFECHVIRFKRTEVITFVMSIQRIKHLSPSYADLRINSYGHIQHGWCQVFFQRHFPKDDFPSDNFVSGTFTNLQFSKRLCWPSGAPQAVMGAEGCGQNRLWSRALGLEQAMGQSAAARTWYGVSTTTSRLWKLALGKFQVNEVAAWKNAFGKVPNITRITSIEGSCIYPLI